MKKMVEWRNTIPTESPVVIDADAPILCNISWHIFVICFDIYMWYILTYICDISWHIFVIYLDIYLCSIFILGRSSIQAWLKLRRDWATGKLIASRTSLSLSDLYPWQFTPAQRNWQNRLQQWYPVTPSLRTNCDSGYLSVDPWRVVPHLSSLWQLTFLTVINRPISSSECNVYCIYTIYILYTYTIYILYT